jgi:hypothetical protein
MEEFWKKKNKKKQKKKQKKTKSKKIFATKRVKFHILPS